MHKTKCIIVDDEPLAIEVIENHLSKFDDFEIVAKCSNAVSAFEIIRKTHVDLIFLDIQMPKITGVDFLKSLRNSPKVIFTTAYRDYAIEAYELDVVDYLLKPISFERFLKAINKFYEVSGRDLNIFNQNGSVSIDQDQYTYIKADKKLHKVFLKDIIYIEALKDYVKIICKKKSLITKHPISTFEEKLPQEYFIRIHRSYIINFALIEAFNSTEIDIHDRQLPIGRSYKNHVLKVLNISEGSI
ncbi:MAG: response regulator [Bacteroidales bacterium]|nr:response regulator [Bacteroidales bacterium]